MGLRKSIGRRSGWLGGAMLLAALILSPNHIRAATDAKTIPLHGGQLVVKEFAASLGGGLPNAFPNWLTHDLTGDRGTQFVRQLNDILSESGSASLQNGALQLSINRDKLPADRTTSRRLVRLLMTGAATRPVTLDARFGLFLPQQLDPTRPLVILIHGLDSTAGIWGNMAKLMADDGQQIAYFSYPDDGPIAESADLLTDCLADLRLAKPTIRVQLIGHSMGGLVARQAVEGAGYRGGVDRLIMLGTPNHGSSWSGWRWALEWNEHYKICQSDPNWKWRWMKEDGNGEAAGDLKPESAFLHELNTLPRRPGVRYTIVAGSQNAARNVGADWLDCTATWFPTRTQQWWGFRQCHTGLVNKAKTMRVFQSSGDGPVSVESCRLQGVDDFSVVHADHTGLTCGDPPAAWAIVRARLRS